MIVFTRLHKDESGVVTIIVAVFVVVLFGFMALAIDVARLYLEKQQLQSSADLSALAGSQFLWKSKTDAEAHGQLFVTRNPSVHHPGAYSTSGGDLVEAKRQAEGTGCRANVDPATGSVTLDPTGTESFDCVESTVTAPAFDFLFASVLGFEQRSLTTKSTAVMGAGAPRGHTLVPWLLRDCPNGALYPEEADEVVAECPYSFTDSFVNNPADSRVTTFEENENFIGAVMPYEAIGCPRQDGYKSGMSTSNAVHSALNQGAAGYVPCRIAPGMRMDTRGGSLGSQLAADLLVRGISTSTCANAAAFDAALDRTGDGDGYVSIRARNACLMNVSFVAYAVPASRVSTVDDDVAGTPAGMQANVTESSPSDGSRFDDLKNNERVVVRRLAWFYITGFTSGSQPKPIGVYLRAIDNQNSTMVGNMDQCPATQDITCAQHGIYIAKLIN